MNAVQEPIYMSVVEDLNCKPREIIKASAVRQKSREEKLAKWLRGVLMIEKAHSNGNTKAAQDALNQLCAGRKQSKKATTQKRGK